MAADHLYIWFNEYLSGDISPQDLQELNKWLEESEDNRLLLDRVERLWNLTGKITIDLNLDVNSAWEYTQERISASKRPIHLQFFSSTWYKVAAAVLLVAITGAVYFFTKANRDYQVYETLTLQTQLVTLPDGSKVWLNENSQLLVASDFSVDHRNLDLTGEAFFEVTRDLDHPLVVHTKNLKTTVLGTSFNVKAIAHDSTSEVTVVTGKVGVSLLGGTDQMVLLTSGNTAQYQLGASRITKLENRDPNFLAWKNKRLVFEDTPLEDIKVVLESYFKVPIHIGNMDIAKCQLTSNFDDPTLQEVLEVISLTLNLQYEKVNESYLITGQGCKVP